MGWAGIRVEVVIKIIEEARRSDQDARVLAEVRGGFFSICRVNNYFFFCFHDM